MNFLIDYLGISMRVHCLEMLFHRLRLNPENLQSCKSYYGYPVCMIYGGIKVNYRCIDGYMYDVFLDMSGKGCRTLEQLYKDSGEELDWFEFIHFYDHMLRHKDAHIARIDIACDDLEGLLDMHVLKSYTRNELYVCRCKSLPLIMDIRESEIIFGSSSSDRRLRIYDKALEQKRPGHWIRCEFQLRNQNAMSMYLNWCVVRDIGLLYCGLMIDYLRFVTVPCGSNISSYKDHSNLHRLETAPFWETFLNSAERLSQMYLPGDDYSLSDLTRYVNSTKSSAKTYILSEDKSPDEFYNEVMGVPLNSRQKLLLDRLNKKY